MLRTLLMVLAVLVGSPALAQTDLKLGKPEQLLLYKSTVPDLAEGTGTLEFEILMSPSLEIREVEVLAGRPLCDCWKIGNPPRRVCLIGCPGSGGGGGGVLLENPLLVEFMTKRPEGMENGDVASLEVLVTPLGSKRVEATEFNFELEQ